MSHNDDSIQEVPTNVAIHIGEVRGYEFRGYRGISLYSVPLYGTIHCVMKLIIIARWTTPPSSSQTAPTSPLKMLSLLT